MAMKLAKGKTLPIGVDLGSSIVKVAQLRLVENEVELIAAKSAGVPAECRTNLRERLRFLGKCLRGLVRSGAFKGNQCILSIPAAATSVQHVRVPKLPPNETANAVRAELAAKLRYPVHEAVVRHIVAGDIYGDSDTKQEVIAVAVPRSTIDAYLQMAQHTKLDVVGINVEPCAIVECFSRLFRRASDAARSTLFLDVGATTTQVVLSQGTELVFARNLMVGGDQLDQAIAEGLDIPLAQARELRLEVLRGNKQGAEADAVYAQLNSRLVQLAEELTQCLRYYEAVFRNQPIERAIFIGGQAYDKRLCQAIAQRLNLPAQIGDPLMRVRRAEGGEADLSVDPNQPQPNWAVAVGLSLGAARAA